MALDVYAKGRLVFAAAVCTAGAVGLGWYLWSASLYKTYEIDTHDAVSGLIADAPVEFHGVEVGKVVKVELVDAATVRILANIAQAAPITQATVATVATRGLTARGFAGYVYIALENSGAGTGAPPRTAGDYPVIAAAPAQSAAMDTRVTEVTAKVDELIGLLHALLDEPTIAALKQTLGGLQQITATLAVNNDHLASLMVNADRDSHDLEPVLTDLRALLPQLARTTGDLETLSRAVTELANRVSRDPSVLLRGTQVRPGPGER